MGSGTVAYKDRVIVFVKFNLGQLNAEFSGGSSRHVYMYDPRAETWSEFTPLPVTPLAGVVACVHDGRLTVAGTFETFYGTELPFLLEFDDRAGWTEVGLRNTDWPSQLEAVVSFPLG